MPWNNLAVTFLSWNAGLGLIGTSLCRNVRDNNPTNKDEAADFGESIWCVTKTNDEHNYEWDYCDPLPAVVCPEGGVLLSRKTSYFGLLKKRAYCVEN